MPYDEAIGDRPVADREIPASRVEPALGERRSMDAPTRERPAEERPRTRPDERRDPRPSEDDRDHSEDKAASEDRAGDKESGADDKKDGGKGDGKAKKKSPWVRIILIALVLVAIAGGVYYWWSNRDLESTDDAYTDGRAITIAPKVAGYVTQLNVTDNQFVKAGTVLVRIDARDYIAARDQARGQLEAAQGQLAAAKAGLLVARKNFPARLASSQAQLQSAKAALAKAQADARRQHAISRAATTQEQVDQADAALLQAQANVAAAEAAVQEAMPVQENIDQTAAQASQLDGQVAQAKAQLDQAELNIGYTTITAPQDGWVTKRNVEMGNYLQAGGSIMSIVSPDVWITANFKESQLNRMRPNQKVDVSVDAYPDLKLSGHVDSIQLGSGSRFTAFPAENATGNYVKIVQRIPVKIIIDSGLDRPLPLGLSVEPTVHLK